MTLEQGTLLNGRYRIVDILGQGGMGSVYRALDENLGVEVAVKENLFTTDEYSRQFRLEAVILASLRHQNLPRVTDHFVMEGHGQYLVMDYIEGEDLRQRMERLNTIPEEDAILVGAAVCDALSYLHTRRPPVLHRDIKPGNIKITPDGRVYLVDFGLAKLIQGSQTTTTGARAMTPGYSPPEQYGTARTDPRSDVYSLGATLYAALTSVIPEDGLARVMENVQLTPVRKHSPKVSRRLSAVIEKAMEAYPDDRYQTADEFRRGLLNSSSKTQRFTELDLNISVPPPPEEEEAQGAKKNNLSPSTPVKVVMDVVTSMTSRMRRRARRDATLGIWGGTILLLLAMLLFWNTSPTFRQGIGALLPYATPDVGAQATVTLDPSSTQPPPLDEPTATQTAVPLPTDTPQPSPTATPVGGGMGQIAFASQRTGTPQIHIINVDGTGLRQITNEQDGACQPDWSPDGKRLVYVSPCKQKLDVYQGSSLYLIDVTGENRAALPTSLGGDFEPAWSPDGRRIAFTSLRDGYMEIYMITLETNQVTRLTRAQNIPRGVHARMPAWNPTGFQIAYVFKRSGGTTQIWVTTDGDVYSPKPNEQLAQTGNETNDFLPAWTRDGQFILFNQTNFEGTVPAWLMSIRYEERHAKQSTRLPVEPLPVVDVSISPDGFWMTFESWPDSLNHDIYISTLTGANRIRLTTDPLTDFDPVWRPIKND